MTANASLHSRSEQLVAQARDHLVAQQASGVHLDLLSTFATSTLFDAVIVDHRKQATNPNIFPAFAFAEKRLILDWGSARGRNAQLSDC